MGESEQIKIAVSAQEKRQLKAKAAAEGVTMQSVFYPMVQGWLAAGSTPASTAPASTAEHGQPRPFAAELHALNLILAGRDASAKRAVRALLREFGDAQQQGTTETDIASALRDAERVALEAKRIEEAGREASEAGHQGPDARRDRRARKA